MLCLASGRRSTEGRVWRMPGWVRALTSRRVVIGRSLWEPCSAAVPRESENLDQVPDSGLGPGGDLPLLPVSPCFASRADASKTGNCLVFGALMSTPLAASSRKALFDIQVRTDRLSVCEERSAPQQRAYSGGASGPHSLGRGLCSPAPRPGRGWSRCGA